MATGQSRSHVNIVQGDQKGDFNAAKFGDNCIFNINRDQPGEQKKLSSVVRDYKTFLTRENENTTLRTKLGQLQVGSSNYFLQRKLKKEGGNASIASSDLLRNIPRSKTSLVSGPSGSGKSTLAANITVDWAESEDDGSYEVVLYLSSLNTTKSLTLHKLVWGEFAGRIGDDSKEIYRELLKKKEKILVIIDGLGN